MDTIEQHTDEMVHEFLNKQPVTKCEYKHERVAVLEDVRVQVKITCDDEWLEKPVSVVTNNDQIGITPFGTVHVAKLITNDEQGQSVVLLGYFDEDDLREVD